MKRLSLLFLLAAALTAPAGAAGGGMDAMKYYVGSWTCTAGSTNQQPVSATVEYTLNDGVLRQWPAAGLCMLVLAIAFAAAMLAGR